ncbi:hypothetical protein D3C78_1010080 [compost metagenome]
MTGTASFSASNQRQTVHKRLELQLAQHWSSRCTLNSVKRHILPGLFNRNLTINRRQALAHDCILGMVDEIFLHLAL